ncbi:MAG: ATP-dependent DNA helicase [Cyanobacteria bacterium J06623_5]
MPVIETEVHQRLRAYLREQGHTQWPHHLTMARLVARALRVGRSALIQTDSLAAYKGTHRLSYLIPALLWPEPAVLALPKSVCETFLQQDIPNLQQSLPVIKPVQVGDRWPGDDFRGLLVTAIDDWLGDRLVSLTCASADAAYQSRFPAGIPTLIDGADALEQLIRAQLSISISSQDWDGLMLAYPSQHTAIRDLRVRLTHTIFQHPANPYSCHLIDELEADLLCELHQVLQPGIEDGRLPLCWQRFWQRFFQPERLAWSYLNRDLGSVELFCAPADIQALLEPVWSQQPIVLMGTALDTDKQAKQYRDRLGLGDMTCLRFAPDRHHDLIQLYLPDRLPMPNTSRFKAAVLLEIRSLLSARHTALRERHCGFADSFPADEALTDGVHANRMSADGPTVIVVGDTPLRTQFASILAAEYGSRVQVESVVGPGGVLVTGWDYWLANRAAFAPPGLLIITTLPIPSLENPLVSGRVATYKRRRQDWFKAYLLPETLSVLQRAIAPVRLYSGAGGGVVALLDNRVNYRSYGRQILSALSPAARSSYLDPTWFYQVACPMPTPGKKATDNR